MSEDRYIGTELEIFAHAKNWKSYVRARVRPYLTGDVLEVGAGIGAATLGLNDGTARRWLCLEPDRTLAERLEATVVPSLPNCEVAVGTLAALDAHALFDAILYMDVLEHIEDDSGELIRAAKHLRMNGCVVVVAPALPWLYSPFDAALGHYRRYTKDSLRAIAPPDFQEAECKYLDSVGVLASAGNRLLLRASDPRLGQILFWDRFLVPISRFADAAVAHSFGRSVLAVWRKVRQRGTSSDVGGKVPATATSNPSLMRDPQSPEP